MMATEAIRRGWQGRALAHHCRAMALYAEPYLQRLSGTLRKARVSVVSDPHTGPLHARVRDLLGEGINVCLGQDDISDAYYPFGRNNMLEVAFLASHLLWMTGREDIERLYDMITVAPAKAINVPDHALAVGAEANLVVLGEPDVSRRYASTPPLALSSATAGVSIWRACRSWRAAPAGRSRSAFEKNAASLRAAPKSWAPLWSDNPAPPTRRLQQ